ncbi:L-lysine exporter family protein LysE/ArgO [Paenibacillus forsythiae]|uniref:L-lysine exporter family protein LysE/ArgO n=1 Tax=Paenibacillus forsythiae TaxID=365616 RepID=A0ABU3H3Y6_9BACL|nr:LysE family transporter [Paenibacillus forsythiae]MDT3425532.1 L-lysine exporter family protein LysE/ArgO [Paenibacillus forsythiae]
MEAAIHGIVLAIGLILPLGAQNIFVFNQGALQLRYTRALPAVITAALCDTLLILAAVGGAALAVLSLKWLTPFIYGAGACFLTVMGWKILRGSQAGNRAVTLPAKEQIAYALSVSLLNPHALMDTVGVIGTSSLQYGGAERWAFAAAASGVSWLWFMTLAATGSALGKADPSGRRVRALNRVSALLLWGMAGYMLRQLWNVLSA